MAEPFLGEIRMFAGTFAPSGWALCNGRLLPIAEYGDLFALLGTLHGGDGRTTFGVPDLRGRIPIHAGDGAGSGLTPRTLGGRGGSETVTLTPAELPRHEHRFHATASTATSRDPVGNSPAEAQLDVYVDTLSPLQLSPAAVSETGGNAPHSNLMPYLCVNFIIALAGIVPSRL
jgi:microcystin-dependent protein